MASTAAFIFIFIFYFFLYQSVTYRKVHIYKCRSWWISTKWMQLMNRPQINKHKITNIPEAFLLPSSHHCLPLGRELLSWPLTPAWGALSAVVPGQVVLKSDPESDYMAKLQKGLQEVASSDQERLWYILVAEPQILNSKMPFGFSWLAKATSSLCQKRTVSPRPRPRWSCIGTSQRDTDSLQVLLTLLISSGQQLGSDPRLAGWGLKLTS